MTTISHTLATGTTVIALLAAPQAATAAPAAETVAELGAPLAQAHAHNDYEHDRPLLDALEHGFTSVEADVWLVDGELRVAHDAWELAEAPTLEVGCLDPLAELVSSDGKQLCPGDDGDFQLLIDIKSEGPQTWAAIEGELAEHRKFITRYHHGEVKDRAVEAVISGNRPLADMQAAEREALHDYVEQAHAAGYRVRFWATNDIAGSARENLWSELRAAGVDHIDTDDLPGLQEFLTR